MDITQLRQGNQLTSEIRELERALLGFESVDPSGFFIQTDLISATLAATLKQEYIRGLEEALRNAKARFESL